MCSRGITLPEVSGLDARRAAPVVEVKTVCVPDPGTQGVKVHLVDFLVRRQQKNLMTRVGKVLRDEMLSMRGIQATERSIDDSGERASRCTRQTPEHGDRQELSFPSR